VALIAGGADRGLDYSALGQALADRRQPTVVLTAYTTGPAIAEATRSAIAVTPASTVEVMPCTDLTAAVGAAWQWARPDGVVLLSPAAASFDAFDDYRHRSAVFAQAVAALTADNRDNNDV
jgi:UDP-N-acetylmuramoylalanine--D-glutamate ligase